MFDKVILSLLITGIILSVFGCGSHQSTYESIAKNYRTITAEPLRDTDAAKLDNQKGLKHLAKDELDQAADAFKKALTADIEFGPAHNNLGKVYYKKKEWYKAAWEFEYTCELLPGNAASRNNLGLVFEKIGELDNAVEHYRQAVRCEDENVHYRANLVRALIRRGDQTDEVRSLLQKVVEKDTRSEWLIWAKQQQAIIGNSSIYHEGGDVK